MFYKQLVSKGLVICFYITLNIMNIKIILYSWLAEDLLGAYDTANTQTLNIATYIRLRFYCLVSWRGDHIVAG